MTSLQSNRRQTAGPVLRYSGRGTINTDSILLFLTALTPILQHYKGVFVNPSLAFTSLLAVVALIRLLMRKVKLDVGFLFLLAYSVYASLIHGVNLTYLMREMVQVVVYLAVINGLFEMQKLLRYYRLIAICATVLIILQYICYYILGFHLQLVAISLLDPVNSQWFDLVRTGLIGVTGTRLAFYRPSAFFLEPSHFAIYCIPVIVAILFSRTGDEKRERRTALFISIGVLLSTSGMGIGIVVMCWAIYLVFFYRQKGEARTVRLRKLLNLRSITLFILFIAVIAVLYTSVPVFRQSVRRIFIAEGNSSLTALEGRTVTGRRSLQMLHGVRKFIGFGDIYNIGGWNMAAFYFVTFKFGWVCMSLFYSFYVYSLFHLRRESQMMTLVFLILSFFTVHMFGAYYKMYYTMIILNGYVQHRQEKTEFWQ